MWKPNKTPTESPSAKIPTTRDERKETKPDTTPEDCLKAGQKLQDRWEIAAQLLSPKTDPDVRYTTYVAYDTLLAELVTIKCDPKWPVPKPKPEIGKENKGSTKVSQNREPSLQAEHDVLAKIKAGDLEPFESIRRSVGFQHIVGLLESGREPSFGFLVTTRVAGPTLDDVRKMAPDGQFTLNTTLMLLDQILTAIQVVHRAGYVHRDIQPGHFTFGSKPSQSTVDLGSHTLYLTDLTTVAKKGNAPKMHKGNFKTPQRFKLNRRYSSRHAHTPGENAGSVGRIDDLWPVFHIMIEMLTGKLPWTEETKVNEIRDQKKYKPLLKFAVKESGGSDMIHLRKFAGYLNEVDTADQIDYTYIRQLLSPSGDDDYLGLGYLVRYDWEMPDSRLQFPADVDDSGNDDLVVPDDDNDA